MSTTGRSSTITGPSFLGYSVDTTDIGRNERDFLDVLDWGLSVAKADILGPGALRSHLRPSAETETRPCPCHTSSVEMDAYPWATSDDPPQHSLLLPRRLLQL